NRDQRRHVAAVGNDSAVAIAPDSLDVGTSGQAAEAVPDEDDARCAGELLDGVDYDLELAGLLIGRDVRHSQQIEPTLEIGEVDPKRLDPRGGGCFCRRLAARTLVHAQDLSPI